MPHPQHITMATEFQRLQSAGRYLGYCITIVSGA
jgi:hypothetical protein